MTDPDAPTPANPKKPSRGWYAFALALMLIGVGAFVASIKVAQKQVDAKVGQMQRVVAPGASELVFTEPGDYLIYYEKIGSFNGEDFDTTIYFEETPALRIDLKHPPTGEFVSVRQAKQDLGESQMFNHGRANSEFVFTLHPEHFSAPDQTPVAYTIDVAHENEGLDHRILLAVGPPVVGSLMSDWRGPFGGAAVLAFAFVVSAATVLVTWMLRHGQMTRRQD